MAGLSSCWPWARSLHSLPRGLFRGHHSVLTLWQLATPEIQERAISQDGDCSLSESSSESDVLSCAHFCLWVSGTQTEPVDGGEDYTGCERQEGGVLGAILESGYHPEAKMLSEFHG